MTNKLILTLITLISLHSCTTTRTTTNLIIPTIQPEISFFSGHNAFNHLSAQLEYGPRTPGSIGHFETQKIIISYLEKMNWEVEIQDGRFLGYAIKNIIGKFGSGSPWTIIGAHYDTRIFADKDSDQMKRTEPVPGANDGASGVAVLLELARVMPADYQGEMWFVFFDGEDNGGIENREWIMGSRYFVNQLDKDILPQKMVLLDMVADKDLNIYMERNSNMRIAADIWDIANDLGYGDEFIPSIKYSIIDDHIPFLQAGIPSVDIIDFDYPYWHTTEDTIDKVSIESLQVVGDTLLTWIIK